MQSIIKKVQVREIEPGAAGPRPQASRAHAPAGPCEQGVRTLSENGQIHAIEITCSCGEVTVVELEYPGATGAEPLEATS